MKQHSTVGERPNVPKRLDSHELNSHKHRQTCTHPCPSPSLSKPPLSYTTYTGITLHRMRWAARWVAFYRGCPSVLVKHTQGKERADKEKRDSLQRFYLLLCKCEQSHLKNVQDGIWRGSPNADIKNYMPQRAGRQRGRRDSAFYYWCECINCGRSEDPLWTHSLFSVDWLVWETLEYNLLALTCSLKKALSTGIRLSWQGQLRLALTVSLYVSLSRCFLSFDLISLVIFWSTCYLSGVHFNSVIHFSLSQT